MRRIQSFFSLIPHCSHCLIKQRSTNHIIGKFLEFPSYLPLISQRTFGGWRNHSQEHHHHHSNAARLLGAGLSVGFSLCFILKKFSNYWPQDGVTLLPSVAAASPFSSSSQTKESNPTLGGNRKNFNFIADVVEKVSDGVVFIDIKDHRRRDRLGNIMSMSNGSGFIVESEGLILTNAHVVTNKPRASSIVVRLSDGREFEGQIEEMDAISDLALVRINCNNLKPMCLGSSKDTRPGEFVVALGSPLSLSNTITSGVISSVGRPSKDLGLGGKDLNYIQTDAAITFGNSGGPLVNLNGEVIGINSMKVTSGISFAIPIDHAVRFLGQAKKKKEFLAKQKEGTLASTGAQKRRYLGITMLTLTPEIIMELQQRGSPTHSQIPADLSHGILVWRVVVGSPAYYAGLQPGDIITQINGHEIESSREVYKILESRSDLRMVVVRGSQRYTITVAPEE